MAKDKNKIIVYSDWIHRFEALSDDEAGRLIKHFFRYVNDLDPEYPDRITELSFIDIKTQLKRDLKNWEKICERNAINGSKGGRPKKPKKPTGLSGLEIKPKKADTDTDTDTDTDKDSNKSNIDFKELLDVIKSETGRAFKIINDKSKRQYSARIKEGYTLEDIKTAVVAACKITYHKENNFQYLTPEFFSRSDTLDKYMHNGKPLTDREKLFAKHNYKPLR